MKKILLILMTLMVIFAFAGCANEDTKAIAGEWLHTDTIVNGESLKYEVGGSYQITFTFEKNGTGEVNLLNMISDITWTLEEDTITVDDGVSQFDLIIDGEKKLIMEVDGGQYILEKP